MGGAGPYGSGPSGFRRWLARLRRLCAAVGIACAALLLAGTARATGDFDDALRGLAQASSETVTAAVERLGALDDRRVLAVLRALRDGNVVADESGHVFLREAGGRLVDASSGQPAGAVGAHEAPVDNSARRALAPLIARLELEDADSTVRLAAVDVLAQRASDDDAPMLRRALEREKSPEVGRAIASALAELDLASTDATRRLAAIDAIERFGAARFRPRLRALVERHADGSYSEPDARVRERANRALGWLETKQTIIGAAADLLYGLSTGSILLLCALGLAITFGLMRVINMAHGEMLMLGAYATYATQVFFRNHLPSHASMYLVAAVPAALLSCMAVGALLERTVIRFLYGRPLETLLATYGLSLLLIQTVRSLFGAQNVAVENPPLLSGGIEVFEGIVLPYSRIAVVVFAVLVVAFVGYVLRGTSLGLRVRAVTQNRPMAACIGIRTARVDTWTFALGSGVGGLGGVALSQLGNVGPELGQGYIIDSFLVVVLGGVGKLVGCVVAAFSLGILNKVLEPIAGAVLGKIVVLLAVVLVIQKRPQGLFAPRVRGVESA
jgi:urea transport system permease protein